MPEFSRRCWYMRVSLGDWSMHDVRSVCFGRTLNCNYGPAVIDVGKGGEKRALGEKGPVEFLTSNDLEQCGHMVNVENYAEG